MRQNQTMSGSLRSFALRGFRQRLYSGTQNDANRNKFYKRMTRRSQYRELIRAVDKTARCRTFPRTLRLRLMFLRAGTTAPILVPRNIIVSLSLIRKSRNLRGSRLPATIRKLIPVRCLLLRKELRAEPCGGWHPDKAESPGPWYLRAEFRSFYFQSAEGQWIAPRCFPVSGPEG